MSQYQIDGLPLRCRLDIGSTGPSRVGLVGIAQLTWPRKGLHLVERQDRSTPMLFLAYYFVHIHREILW